MTFLQNVDNIVVGIMALAGLILVIEKIATWFIKKFNVVHNQVNEVENLKRTLDANTEDVTCLKEQNSLIIQGLRNLLRRQLKEDALEYIASNEITHEEMEEYDITYNIYKNMGGNGIGTRYHEEVMKLKVKVLNNNDDKE